MCKNIFLSFNIRFVNMLCIHMCEGYARVGSFVAALGYCMCRRCILRFYLTVLTISLGGDIDLTLRPRRRSWSVNKWNWNSVSSPVRSFVLYIVREISLCYACGIFARIYSYILRGGMGQSRLVGGFGTSVIPYLFANHPPRATRLQMFSL